MSLSPKIIKTTVDEYLEFLKNKIRRAEELGDQITINKEKEKYIRYKPLASIYLYIYREYYNKDDKDPIPLHVFIDHSGAWGREFYDPKSRAHARNKNDSIRVMGGKGTGVRINIPTDAANDILMSPDLARAMLSNFESISVNKPISPEFIADSSAEYFRFECVVDIPEIIRQFIDSKKSRVRLRTRFNPVGAENRKPKYQSYNEIFTELKNNDNLIFYIRELPEMEEPAFFYKDKVILYNELQKLRRLVKEYDNFLTYPRIKHPIQTNSENKYGHHPGKVIIDFVLSDRAYDFIIFRQEQD